MIPTLERGANHAVRVRARAADGSPASAWMAPMWGKAGKG